MQNPPTLLLIHGAWAGAWVWEPLQLELGKLGLESTAIELPGNGFHPIPAEVVTETDYFAAVDEAIAATHGPVCLVGHSGGGMLVTYGADRHPGKVTHAVWIAGMLLPNGESFDDIQDQVAGKGNRFGITPHAALSEDGRTTTVPPKKATEYFFNDLPLEQAHSLARLLTPQPVAGRRLSVQTGRAFDSVRKLYLHASQDRSVVPEAQRIMAKSAKTLRIETLDSGHCPHVSRPQQTAKLIWSWMHSF